LIAKITMEGGMGQRSSRSSRVRMGRSRQKWPLKSMIRKETSTMKRADTLDSLATMRKLMLQVQKYNLLAQLSKIRDITKVDLED
jgi:hypothetical protein